MDPIIGGALISGASNLLGGLFGGNSAKKQSPGDAFRSEFKQRMAMGEKYGISKLVMAGMSPAGGWSGSVGEPSMGQTLSNMGQDIGRAVAARASQPERDLQKLLLEKAGLENEFLRSQIASVNSRTLRESAPSLPIPDRSGGRLPVAHPGLGQEASNHYGEPGEWFFGVPALVADTMDQSDRWFIDKFGVNPRQYSPWAIGGAMGDATRSWIDRKAALFRSRYAKGSTHYKNRY